MNQRIRTAFAESCSDDGDEPGSDDEAFIDDETVAIEGLFDPAGEIVSFARIIPAKHHTSPFTRVNDDAKAMLEAEDKGKTSSPTHLQMWRSLKIPT